MITIQRITISLLVSIFFMVASTWAEEPGSGGEEKEKKEAKTVLEEITVIGARLETPVTPVETRYGTQYNIVTEEQIKEQNSYDFQSTLRDVPGVMSQSKNSVGSQTGHSLYIRGRGSSHPSPDIIIQFDGAPRFGGLFGQVLGDGIAVSTIGGMEIYKSPQPLQFGSGYAMINILPKYTKKEGQEGALNLSGGSYGTLDESISAGVKKGPFDIFASQSWINTDGNRDNSASYQQNYYANTGYQINREWNIRLVANYVKGSTEAPMPDAIPNITNGVAWPGAERYKTDTFFTTLTLNHEYERFSGYAKGYWNDTTFELLQELNKGKPYAKGTGGLWSEQDIDMYGVRAREKLRLWAGGEILAGADLDMTGLRNTQQTYSGLAVPGINGGRSKRVWDFPNTTLFSPYIGFSQVFGRGEGFHITPSAGLRYYNHNEFEDKSAGQAGLVMGYGNADLSINYSRGVNYPSPVVLMNMVLNSVPVINPDRYWRKIKPEVVDHYELSLTHTWPKMATVGATVFQDKGKDRFQAYMFGPIPGQFNDFIGHYEIRGLELTGTATPVRNLELFAGATWLSAEASGRNGVESNHMPYTPGFQFQAGARLTFLDTFQLFTDMQHLANLYQGTFVRSGTLDVPQLTSKDKLGNITLVNARLSYRFDYIPLKLKDSEIFFVVNNIFNQDYEYAKGYPMPGTTFFAGFNLKFN